VLPFYSGTALQILSAVDTGIHGTDERIAVEAYHGLVRGYREIIRAIDAAEDPLPTPTPADREAAS
jgi:hypothetical protein